MGASASDARADEEVDDVQDDIPRSPLSRRINGEASHLQDLPPVIAALVAEQEFVDDVLQPATGSPAGDDDEPDDDEQPDESDETVANHAKQASLSHPVRFVGSKNIKLSVECELPLSKDSLVYVKLGMLSHGTRGGYPKKSSFLKHLIST